MARPSDVRHIRMAAALFACAALAAGCGGRDQAPGGSAEELRGRTFQSTSETSVTEGGRPRLLVTGTKVSLRFTDDGRLLADAGCNTMAGQVQVRGGSLTVTDLSTTDMGCDPPRHQQDEWLGKFLQAGPTWRLDGTDLVLSSGGTELVLADREVAEPDLALEGTEWVVDTIVDAQTAASLPPGAAASVTFEAGQAAVSTGCNTGTTTYQHSGDTLTFGPLAVTRKACPPDFMPLEQAVLAVLQGTVKIGIDADRLTIDHPSGKGLQLRGER